MSQKGDAYGLQLGPPFSVAAFLLSQALVIAALIVPRSVLTLAHVRLLLFPPVLATTLYLLSSTTRLGTLVDYVTGCALVFSLFSFSNLVLLRDAQAEIRPRHLPAPISHYGLFHRSWWAATLQLNVRGVGWTDQVANLPPISPHQASESRSAFVCSRLARLLISLLVLDATQLYYINKSFGIRADLLTWERVLHTVLLGTITYCLIRSMHSFVAMLAVASGWSAPAEWPELFGPLAESYTIRRFWSRTWHQYNQKFFVSHAKFIARKVLRFPPGTTRSSITQLLVAFTMSGLLHMGGDYMAMRRLDVSYKLFLIQVIPIAVEDWVTNIFSGVLDEKISRALGYVWVFAWFVLCVPWFVNGLLEAGMIDHAMVPYSIIRRIWTGEWAVQEVPLSE
ncbi:hypothetical protein BOTBODRAFT_107794 [Botryobasidium botryosum FD-172 SS1]|uniref:Wax synthase domain-containing protein n=1 Tax=Botryobasidium botryosum (strain FD-172 SS1) TaxID=930990 RepID=A0A067MML8_BOTB1|nr:hypothetical protein BOTBODRAFT_107794 [Botryobasidium botryosum FD-172 SS1]